MNKSPIKICVISNSHAASLKDGWTAIADSFEDIDVTFFAAPNRVMDELVVDYDKRTFFTEDAVIKHMLSFTSGDLSAIEVDQYDAFLVYGMFLSIPRLDTRLSAAVKLATIKDSVEGSLNYRYVVDLCSLTEKPVFYAASPLLSDAILADETTSLSSYHTYPDLCDMIEEHIDYKNALQVRQMASTIGQDLTTQGHYSKGSVRLTKIVTEHVGHDIMHMNAEYGEEYMHMFLSNLQDTLVNPNSANPTSKAA